jgi:integrase
LQDREADNRIGVDLDLSDEQITLHFDLAPLPDRRRIDEPPISLLAQKSLVESRANPYAPDRYTGFPSSHFARFSSRIATRMAFSRMIRIRREPFTGLPGRIPHDFRRTAVRNLERAGVPRSQAMSLTDHKTEAVSALRDRVGQ